MSTFITHDIDMGVERPGPLRELSPVGDVKDLGCNIFKEPFNLFVGQESKTNIVSLQIMC